MPASAGWACSAIASAGPAPSRPFPAGRARARMGARLVLGRGRVRVVVGGEADDAAPRSARGRRGRDGGRRARRRQLVVCVREELARSEKRGGMYDYET